MMKESNVESGSSGISYSRLGEGKGVPVKPRRRFLPKTQLVKMAIGAVVSAFAMSVQAYSGISGTCTYIFFVKSGNFGELDLSNLTEVSIYKIGADGQSLGAKLASARPNGTPTAGAGASVAINLIASTTGDETHAEFGEQLAVVVTSHNYYGDTETWRSYTALPKPTFQGVHEVAGLLGSETGTKDTLGDGLPTMYVNGIDDYSDYYWWANGYPTANSDEDGDGMTTLQEFYAGTDPTGGKIVYGPNWFDTLTLRDWSVSGRNATVKIDKSSKFSYSIRWTKSDPTITTLGQEVPTGTVIPFSTTEGGSQNQRFIYSDDYHDDHTTTQVWFTMPEVEDDYYIGIAVNGVLCAWKKIEAVTASGYEVWAAQNGISGAWDETDTNGVFNVFRYVFDTPTGDFASPLIGISDVGGGKASITTPEVKNTDGFTLSILASDDLAGTVDPVIYPATDAGLTIIDEPGKTNRFFRLKADTSE
ncbi:MAG: hypothetical protein IJR99_01915 [Kiritimatiellae bacterium]|nr:hypothetical protein [Kiritimatiellia bacterium]